MIVAEGEVDWLTFTILAGIDSGSENAPATFGISSGSWTKEIAARIPSGVRVLVATDLDEAGDRYAEKVAASLAGRCQVRRWRAR